MAYNLTGLQNATDYSTTISTLNAATGGLFVMGLLILIHFILFMVQYRSSGLKSAFVGSTFPVALISTLLYPAQLVSQTFFIIYLSMGIIALFVLFQNR